MRSVTISSLALAVGFLAQPASAETWCGEAPVNRVFCDPTGTCHVSTNAYGGSRWYTIEASHQSKSELISLLVTAQATSRTVEFGFVANGLNCSNIAQDTAIYAVILTKP